MVLTKSQKDTPARNIRIYECCHTVNVYDLGYKKYLNVTDDGQQFEV